MTLKEELEVKAEAYTTMALHVQTCIRLMRGNKYDETIEGFRHLVNDLNKNADEFQEEADAITSEEESVTSNENMDFAYTQGRIDEANSMLVNFVNIGVDVVNKNGQRAMVDIGDAIGSIIMDLLGRVDYLKNTMNHDDLDNADPDLWDDDDSYESDSDEIESNDYEPANVMQGQPHPTQVMTTAEFIQKYYPEYVRY